MIIFHENITHHVATYQLLCEVMVLPSISSIMNCSCCNLSVVIRTIHPSHLYNINQLFVLQSITGYMKYPCYWILSVAKQTIWYHILSEVVWNVCVLYSIHYSSLVSNATRQPLSYRNRRFKTPYYGVAPQTLILGLMV
jgi:hypothetical protein